MSHFAKVENGIVTQVIVAEQDVIDSGLFGRGWLQTSYNTSGGLHPEDRPLRKNYAGVGFWYDVVRDAFIPPKPADNWLLDENTCLWVEPQDGQSNPTYVWDDIAMSWVFPENVTVQAEQTYIPITNTIAIDLSSNGADSIIGGADSVNGAI